MFVYILLTAYRIYIFVWERIYWFEETKYNGVYLNETTLWVYSRKVKEVDCIFLLCQLVYPT